MLVYNISQKEIEARQQKLEEQDDDNEFECPICFELFEENERLVDWSVFACITTTV